MDERENQFRREQERLNTLTPEQRKAEREAQIAEFNRRFNENEARRAVECVQKKDLIDGAYYQGSCRNAKVARWFTKQNRFTYWREKFGYTFLEDINHPADDNGFDLFYPRERIDEPTEEAKRIPMTATEQFNLHRE